MRANYNHLLECPLDPASQDLEFELLLTCCRPKPCSAHYLRQQELASAGLDTRKVLALAIRHKVSPLLYYNLRGHPAGTFANELLDKLAEQHKRNSRRALQALHATHELMRAGQDLRLIVMKGLDVAARAYGDVAARHVGDMDILVDPTQLDEAVATLQVKGWVLEQPEIIFPANKKILHHNHHDCHLHRERTPHMELHWRLTRNPFEFPIEDWRNLSVSKKSNLGIPGLNNEDLLIYLCLHGAKHGWGCLKWLFDLPNVLDTHELDWTALWHRAGQLGCGSTIQQGLLLAHKYCGIDLSLEIKSGFKFNISPSQWQVISTLQQGSAQSMAHLPIRLKLQLWINGILAVRKADVRWWYCAVIFYPSIDDYMQIKLPPWLHLLYFPLRPVLWGVRQIRNKQMRD